MARAIWSGALAFGLVNVPVGLYAATQDRTIHFRQFQRGTSSRIRYRRVNEKTGKEVDYDDIVKGYRAESGDYVLLEREELEEIAPGRSRTVEITDFVAAEEIDPIYYQKTYYLAPSREDAERAYRLLVDAMTETDRIAIANFVMRSKQYLAAVRPQDGVLVLETMYFADEVRAPDEELENLPVQSEPSKKDLKMAVSLIDSMTTEWDPGNYEDTYREKVLDLVQAKARGEDVVTPREEEGEGEVVDLMDALRRSVEASRQHRAGNRHQAGALPRSEDEELAGKSKQELYELARSAGVEGRSQMTKEELVEALTSAEGSEQRAS